MPQITAITEQKKNQQKKKANKDSRFNIFLDGKYAFSLNEELLLKMKIRVGKNLEKKEIDTLKSEDSQKKLFDRAMNFLSYRPRSQKEVKDYLIKTIAKGENIKWNDAKESEWPDIIIAKLKKYQLLDDFEFAKWWVDSRSKSKPKGRKLIEIELKNKGIDIKIIEKIIPQKSNIDLKLALQVLKKKERMLSRLQPYEFKKKAYYYLSSRGFDYDIITEAFAIYTKKE